jgi:hypothetical protein
MRYLVIAETKRTVPMPPEQFLELVIPSLEAFVAQEKAGKLITCGIFAGRPGGWDVIPLVSMEKRLELEKGILAQLRAQKK